MSICPTNLHRFQFKSPSQIDICRFYVSYNNWFLSPPFYVFCEYDRKKSVHALRSFVCSWSSSNLSPSSRHRTVSYWAYPEIFIKLTTKQANRNVRSKKSRSFTTRAIFLSRKFLLIKCWNNQLADFKLRSADLSVLFTQPSCFPCN
jgi:hypothetical protein